VKRADISPAKTGVEVFARSPIDFGSSIYGLNRNHCLKQRDYHHGNNQQKAIIYFHWKLISHLRRSGHPTSWLGFRRTIYHITKRFLIIADEEKRSSHDSNPSGRQFESTEVLKIKNPRGLRLAGFAFTNQLGIS
jgi:hypothetical protein